MTFLRLGTACVVFDDAGRVLLSQRGDLKTWNLPGGRLDRGETLEQSAAREVREETGIEIEIERPFGLYYTARWQRLNVTFRAHAVGGTLLGRTHETLANRWFEPHALPQNMLRPEKVADALSGETVLRAYQTPLSDYLSLRWKFGWRWVRNLLSGRPEPRYPRFDVWAIGLVSGDVDYRARCTGRRAPWEELFQAAHSINGGTPEATWLEVRQDVETDMLKFVFAVSAPGAVGYPKEGRHVSG